MTATNGGKQGERMRIGLKQTMKAIELGIAEEVFVAQDADPRMATRIVQACDQRGIKLTRVDTMRDLGRTCGIDVGAAAAARIFDSIE